MNTKILYKTAIVVVGTAAVSAAIWVPQYSAKQLRKQVKKLEILNKELREAEAETKLSLELAKAEIKKTLGELSESVEDTEEWKEIVKEMLLEKQELYNEFQRVLAKRDVEEESSNEEKKRLLEHLRNVTKIQTDEAKQASAIIEKLSEALSDGAEELEKLTVEKQELELKNAELNKINAFLEELNQANVKATNKQIEDLLKGLQEKHKELEDCYWTTVTKDSTVEYGRLCPAQNSNELHWTLVAPNSPNYAQWEQEYKNAEITGKIFKISEKDPSARILPI